MKTCIFGAGAIGAYLGALLTKAGYNTTLIARGPHLEALERNGLTLINSFGEEKVKVRCTGETGQVGCQDCIILAIKTHSVAASLKQIRPLLGPHTMIVTAQNGIPWWYFFRYGGPWDGHRLQAVDPGGAIWETLGPERAIGGVVYPSCEIVSPGVVRHLDGNRFMVGEPDGSKSDRVTNLSKMLCSAGLKAPVRRKIRDDIWLKLWGNLSLNPVSVLTMGTLDQICQDADVRSIVRNMMLEAKAVAERLGVQFSVDVDTRIGWADDVGAHKSSMLQDLEKGRDLEMDSLVDSVQEIARLVGLKTPTLDLVASLVRLRARVEAKNRGLCQ